MAAAGARIMPIAFLFIPNPQPKIKMKPKTKFQLERELEQAERRYRSLVLQFNIQSTEQNMEYREALYEFQKAKEALDNFPHENFDGGLLRLFKWNSNVRVVLEKQN